MNENTPVFDWEDAVNFITDRCEVDKNIVEKVLELEEEYMRNIGIIAESWYRITYESIKKDRGYMSVTENRIVEKEKSFMRTISITEALNELKLYDARIRKATSNIKLVGAAKKSSDKVGVVSKDTFNERAKADYQSVTDLIANRNALKSAIVRANAVTDVTVAGKTMTRAEAIERKNSIEYEELLLLEMKRQYATTMDSVNKENKKVDSKVDELITTLVGRDSDKKLSKEDQEAVEKPYREKNEFEFIDPIGIYDEMLALESDIDGFKSEVDTVLVLSNATSFIEVDF